MLSILPLWLWIILMLPVAIWIISGCKRESYESGIVKLWGWWAFWLLAYLLYYINYMK